MLFTRRVRSAGITWLLAGSVLVLHPHSPCFAATDLEALAQAPPGQKHAYGSDPHQFGELTLPDGPGPYPVVVSIHGGCWLAKYPLDYTRAMANALARDGYAVWNIEYRRVGNEGGGWPGTFQDVAHGADHLRKLAKDHPLDLNRVVAIGHSAGGQLALWLAARPRIQESSELYVADPLPLAGVLALAPAPELDLLHEKAVCGHVVDKLMGGSFTDVPDRYKAAMPSALAPIGVPQVVMVGKLDEDWRPVGELYVEKAREAGDRQVRLIVAPESSHFEVVDPASTTWPLVRDAIRRLGSSD